MSRLCVALVLFLLAAAVVIEAKKCQHICTRKATFSGVIDGKVVHANCNQKVLDGRCGGCCVGYGLTKGAPKDSVFGFPSDDLKTCVCCIQKCED